MKEELLMLWLWNEPLSHDCEYSLWLTEIESRATTKKVVTEESWNEINFGFWLPIKSIQQ